MDFKKLPFQFSSTDPVKRQAELKKRFGLQSLKDSMLVDFPNIGDKLLNEVETPVTGSPRLQHRVPIFSRESEPVKASVDSQGSPGMSRKPRVRNIPIQIERADPYDKWQHVKPSVPLYNSLYHTNGISENVHGPRVCNIPVKVEKKDSKADSKSEPTKLSAEKTVPPEVKKPKTEKVVVNDVPKDSAPNCEEQQPDPKLFIEGSLKKIEHVKRRMEDYRKDVEAFYGVLGDKQYRYLDEMLTRCMLELDAVETYGHEEVRIGRRAMVKEVQACIDLLDSKVRNVDPKSNNQESNVELQNTEMEVSDSEVITNCSDNVTSNDCEMDMKEESPIEPSVENFNGNIEPSEDLHSKQTVKESEEIVMEADEISDMASVEGLQNKSPAVQSVEEGKGDIELSMMECHNEETVAKESSTEEIELQSEVFNISSAEDRLGSLANEPIIEEPCDTDIQEPRLYAEEINEEPCEVDVGSNEELVNSPLVEEPSDSSNSSEPDSCIGSVETVPESNNVLHEKSCNLADNNATFQQKYII